MSFCIFNASEFVWRLAVILFKVQLPLQIRSPFDKGDPIMNLSMLLRKSLTAATILSIILGLNTVSTLFGGEHPGQMAPRTEEEKPRITKEDVAKFAEEYVRKNATDGVFKYHDKNTGKDMELTLDRVHRERLSPTKTDEYFVCADFKGKDGNRYDLDFFVQGTDKDNLRVDKTSISVHKVNGKENYTWDYNKKKDLWEKKTIIVEKEYPEPTKREHPGNP